ncbi:MAG: thiamine pyrophosphate-dependent dehydrogenase E1 component subunit alpha, partial [Candidatus Kapaibacterium sp.]
MSAKSNPFDYNKFKTSKDEKLMLYRNILLPRMIEEKMILLLRQNRISKWFSGIGQEAISVGSTLAMHDDEYILPMHRNLGVFTSRNMSLKKLFSQFQGKANGYTKGRDRSFHFGSIEDKVIGMISHLGPQLSIANGLSLAKKLKSEQKGTLVFTGDGGTSEGEFHEALNLAAVWKLPVIFLVENNGYGLSTPSSEQFAMKDFVSKGPGYGIKAKKVDGNNILEVYETVKDIMTQMRENPEPVLLECITFRMRGHEESSGTKYIPQELFVEWAKKDPVVN